MAGNEREARFKAYFSRLAELKEAGALREVVEEEVFLEFIRANRDRINEFPLLEVEQKSVIDILRRACVDHPGHDYIHDRINTFLLALNRLGKAETLGDRAGAERAGTELSNAESVLVKAVQGAVYAASLVKDNFSDAVIRHFGEESLSAIDHITETMEFDAGYWKAYIETFIREKVNEAYKESIARRKYAVSREGGFLVVRFPFDEVLARLRRTDKEIQKTRVQARFEEAAASGEGRAVRKFIASFLTGNQTPVTAGKASASEILHVAAVAGLDSLAEEFVAAFSASGGPQGETTGEEADKAEAHRRFLREQLTALCVGAAMVGAAVRRDFTAALKEFDAREALVIGKLIGNFESGRVEKTLLVVLEFYFLTLLRKKGAKEGGKVAVKAVRVRRAPRAEVDGLEAEGLTRIRRRRLFEADPDNADMLLYKAVSVDEYRKLLGVLQLEPPLAKRLYDMWGAASFKIEFLVMINLAAVDKVTTNLPQRIGEILAGYGVANRQ